MEGNLTQKCLWLKHFEELPDPLLDRKKQHLLMDILVLTLCAVICGATSWESIEEFHNLGEEERRTEGKALIPAPNMLFSKLLNINSSLIDYAQKKNRSEIATLDQDATLAETYKSAAFYCMLVVYL